MWLTDHVHNTRRDLLLIAIGLLIGCAAITSSGLFVLSWYGCALALILMLVAYVICGGFRAEEPVINAQTICPRQNDVARSQLRLSWLGPEQIRREIAYVIAALTAPIHLLVEAWRLLQKRTRLCDIYEEEVARVLAAIVERDGAIDVNELFQRFGDGPASDALLQMHDLSPVIWLHDPERVSLTTEARESIRAG